jgi:hypothetical protein
MGEHYDVTRKEPIRKFNAEMEVMSYFRIFATSKGGTRFWIEVPESDLGTPKVDAALTKRAKELDAIK